MSMRLRNYIKQLNSYLPNLKESWALLGLTAIAGMLIAGLATVAISFIAPSATRWADMIIYPLVFIPAALYISISIKNRREISFVTGESNYPSVPLNSNRFGKVGAPLSFFIIFFLIFSFNIATEPLYTWMGTPDFLKEFFENMKQNPVSSFISVAIFAPLLEELLCRGIILRGLLHSISPLKAIFWSALMFAVMHLNPWQALPAFMIGMLMGWIYWKTGSLWATIFIHFVNNGFSFLITILFPEMAVETTFSSLMSPNLYIFVYSASIVFTIGAIFILNRNYDKSISTEV